MEESSQVPNGKVGGLAVAAAATTRCAKLQGKTGNKTTSSPGRTKKVADQEEALQEA